MKHGINKGVFFALLSYIIWGVMPVYWQALNPIDSFVIIFYRIILVAIVSFLCVWKTEGLGNLRQAIRPKGAIPTFVIAGAFITINWSIYVWAVKANFVIQTSIGHYIEPLMIALFGVILFRETLTKAKLWAFLLAAAGVISMIVVSGEVPLLAICLGSSFAVYAAVKKKVRCSSMVSLFYETIFFAPAAVIILMYLEMTGQGALQVATPWKYGILMTVGAVTVLVLWLFSEAENRTSLSNIGFIAYLAPTISLLMGVFLFREPFDRGQLPGFVLIWIALAVFALGSVKKTKRKESSPCLENR